MIFTTRSLSCICLMAAIALMSCGNDRRSSQPATDSSAASSTTSSATKTDTATSSGTTGGSYEGTEKVKPAPGTGNLQGKVLYNSKPVEGIEVKLCEKFNRYFGGCDGKTYTARTDANGEYVITNVEPKVYEGLLAQVFNTDSYIFAASGIGGLNTTTYEIRADKTLFVAPTNLFKDDLKVVSPRAGSKTGSKNLELKWESYPEAVYYKFSLYPEDVSVTSPYINERVDSTSFALDKPLPKGIYRWQLEAFNGEDKKLAENSRDIKFTVTE
jgi:hypothetical protein